MYKTKEKKKFKKEINDHFDFDFKVLQANLSPKPLDSKEYFFDEEALVKFLHFDNLKQAAYRAKNLGKPTLEDFDGGKKDVAALEIEVEVESENDQIDQNELFDSLLADTSNQVLSCEVSAINCFDSILGKRSKFWLESILFY